MTIYYINILSVGQATKGKNIKTWKYDFLDPHFNFLEFLHISIISNSFVTYGCCHSYSLFLTSVVPPSVSSSSAVGIFGEGKLIYAGLATLEY